MDTLASELSGNSYLEGLQRGDKQSFTAIYSLYWYKLYLIAYKRLKEREVCEEIVQDVFVTLWEKRDSSRIVNLEHYLVKSMKYKVIDHIRSQIVKNNYLEYHKIYLEQAESQTENTVALNDLSYAIETGLRTLPERSRQVFRLSRYESWPVSEIASHLNLSEKGVEYHLTKSIRTLRIYLKEIATVVLFVFSV